MPPGFIRTHIQLAAHDLTNNHTKNLLSVLLLQAHCIYSVASENCYVNEKEANAHRFI